MRDALFDRLRGLAELARCLSQSESEQAGGAGFGSGDTWRYPQ